MKSRMEGSSWIQGSRLMIDAGVSHRTVGSLMMAQSYPDSQTLTAPLQKILNETQLTPKFFLGLTHLKQLASIESIALSSRLPLGTGESFILLNEVLPFEHQVRCPTTGINRSPSSCLLELTEEKIGLEIFKFLSFRGSEALPKALEALSQIQTEILFCQKQLQADFPKSYQRACRPDEDFNSSDLWISVVDWLKAEKLPTGKQFAMLTGTPRRISICFGKVNSIPLFDLTVEDQREAKVIN